MCQTFSKQRYRKPLQKFKVNRRLSIVGDVDNHDHNHDEMMIQMMMRMTVLRSHTILSTPDFLPQIGRWSNNGQALVRFGTVSYGFVRFGTLWYGLVWHGVVWYGLVRLGVVWYGSNNGGTTREGIAQRQPIIPDIIKLS